MTKPGKTITVEYGQWGEAERQVDRYLDRAGDTAWCEVRMKSSSGTMLAYRAGNKNCQFPEGSCEQKTKTTRGRTTSLRSTADTGAKPASAKSPARAATPAPDTSSTSLEPAGTATAPAGKNLWTQDL